ncbi:MAG: hypothetical protein QW445_03390 [Candidatus Bathyarchaeia archaeon]
MSKNECQNCQKLSLESDENESKKCVLKKMCVCARQKRKEKKEKKKKRWRKEKEKK